MDLMSCVGTMGTLAPNLQVGNQKRRFLRILRRELLFGRPYDFAFDQVVGISFLVTGDNL